MKGGELKFASLTEEDRNSHHSEIISEVTLFLRSFCFCHQQYIETAIYCFHEKLKESWSVYSRHLFGRVNDPNNENGRLTI